MRKPAQVGEIWLSETEIVVPLIPVGTAVRMLRAQESTMGLLDAMFAALARYINRRKS